MAGVTNRISVEEAADLLERPGRAGLSFVREGRPLVEPVAFRRRADRFQVRPTGDPGPEEGDEVVLVVDEGVLFFDLRAVYVRGRWRLAPVDADGGVGWSDIEPTRITCWDYGRLRADDDHD